MSASFTGPTTFPPSSSYPTTMPSPVSASLDSHAFDEALKLIHVFEGLRRGCTTVREFNTRINAERESINSILKYHPEASTILALAAVHLIKTNQWQLLQLIHHYFRSNNQEIFRLCGWNAVTFNNPLELPEIRKIQGAFLKVKETKDLPIAYSITDSLMQKAANMEEGETMGIIASFRDRMRIDPSNPQNYPLIMPIIPTPHKTAVLMQKVDGELRIFVADSVVDKLCRIGDQYFVYPLQDDILEQLHAHIKPEMNAVFYRLPSSLEDPQPTPLENYEYVSKYHTQKDGFNCSIFALRNLYEMHRLARKGQLWDSLSISSEWGDSRTRVVDKIPAPFLLSTQSMTIVRAHTESKWLLETLNRKNAIADVRLDNGQVRPGNKFSDRMRYKYDHLAMIPSDVLDRQFLRDWASYRAPFLNVRPDLALMAAPEPVDLIGSIHAQKHLSRRNEGQQIKALFEQLPLDFLHKVYEKIWELHGRPMSDDPNWGANNVCSNMDIFYNALHEVTAVHSLTAPHTPSGDSSARFYGALHNFLLQLPQADRDRFYNEIRILGAGPIEDPNWGQSHAYEDLTRLYRALGTIFSQYSAQSSVHTSSEELVLLFEGHLRTFINEIPQTYRDLIYENVWIHGGRVEGDPYWGQNHAFDNLSLLWLAISHAMPTATMTEPSSSILTPPSSN